MRWLRIWGRCCRYIRINVDKQCSHIVYVHMPKSHPRFLTGGVYMLSCVSKLQFSLYCFLAPPKSLYLLCYIIIILRLHTIHTPLKLSHPHKHDPNECRVMQYPFKPMSHGVALVAGLSRHPYTLSYWTCEWGTGHQIQIDCNERRFIRPRARIHLHPNWENGVFWGGKCMCALGIVCMWVWRATQKQQ